MYQGISLCDTETNRFSEMPLRGGDKVKILHTADIHLKEYEDERWRTLEELIKIGKQEKIEIFVISGDLFDTGINAENLRPKIRDIFSNAGFKIVLIPGNHDSDCYPAGTYFGGDASILADLNVPFEHGELNIWGMPFEPIDGEGILRRLHHLASRSSSSKKNILLYHGELLDAFFSRTDFGEEGEERYMPVKLSYFKDLNIDYVLAGHFHSSFDVHKLESGGYFVYPGSPVSITKKETGRRRVNIFEVGQPPKEYYLDTPHFEEILIELDPFQRENPVEVVTGRLVSLHPEARGILTVKGFVNGEALGVTETGLVEQIEQVAGNRCVNKHYEFKDIGLILEDDLFKSFVEKLTRTDYEEEKKKRMRLMAIRAMMQVRS